MKPGVLLIFIAAIVANAQQSESGGAHPERLRMALVNIKCVLSDGPDLEKNQAAIAANLRRHLYFVDRLAAEGADFIGFPELSLNGYHFSPAMTWLKLDGPEVEALRRKADEKGVYIAAGLALQEDETTRRNAHVLVGPAGEITGVHYKIYLTKETGLVTPGAEHRVFEVKGMKMGIAICADGSDRKNLEALAEGGAQIIYGPHANTTGGTLAGWYKFRAPWSGPEGWIAQLHVHAAIHNHAALYEPSFDAPDGDEQRAGWASGARFIGPDGQTLAEMPVSTDKADSKEFVLIHDIPIPGR